MESWKKEGHTFYRVRGPLVPQLQVNQFVYDESGDKPLYAVVKEKAGRITWQNVAALLSEASAYEKVNSAGASWARHERSRRRAVRSSAGMGDAKRSGTIPRGTVM